MKERRGRKVRFHIGTSVELSEVPLGILCKLQTADQPDALGDSPCTPSVVDIKEITNKPVYTKAAAALECASECLHK